MKHGYVEVNWTEVAKAALRAEKEDVLKFLLDDGGKVLQKYQLQEIDWSRVKDEWNPWSNPADEAEENAENDEARGDAVLGAVLGVVKLFGAYGIDIDWSRMASRASGWGFHVVRGRISQGPMSKIACDPKLAKDPTRCIFSCLVAFERDPSVHLWLTPPFYFVGRVWRLSLKRYGPSPALRRLCFRLLQRDAENCLPAAEDSFLFYQIKCVTQTQPPFVMTKQGDWPDIGCVGDKDRKDNQTWFGWNQSACLSAEQTRKFLHSEEEGGNQFLVSFCS